MSDLDTQIRQTLERHAAAVRPDAGAWSAIAERIERGSPIELRDIGARKRRTPMLLAAAAVLVVAMVGAFLVTRDDDASIDLGPAATDEIEGGVPGWFDPSSAPPVFQSKQRDPQSAANAYIVDRFAGGVSGALTVDSTVSDGMLATTQWRMTESNESIIASGTIVLRHDEQESEWEVVGSFIDQVDLDRATHNGVRARVSGSNGSGQTARLVVDDGTPSPLDDRFDHTVEVGTEATTTRIELVGGTILGVAELRLDPPKGYPIWPVLGFEALADLQLDADERQLSVETPAEVAISFAIDVLDFGTATVALDGGIADFHTVTLDVDGGQQLLVDLGRENREGALWYVIGAATKDLGTFVEDGGVAITAPVAGTVGLRLSNEIAPAGSLPHDQRVPAGDGSFFPLSGTGILQVELAGDDGHIYVAIAMVRP